MQFSISAIQTILFQALLILLIQLMVIIVGIRLGIFVWMAKKILATWKKIQKHKKDKPSGKSHP